MDKFDNGSIKLEITLIVPSTLVCVLSLSTSTKAILQGAYMYMFTCYEDLSWTEQTHPLCSMPTKHGLCWNLGQKDLLLTWDRQDPVSEKERTEWQPFIKYNKINPFIDYPELVEFIWGNKQGQPWSAVGGEYPYLSLPSSGSKLILERLFWKHATTPLRVKESIWRWFDTRFKWCQCSRFSLPTTTVSKVAAEAGIDILVRFDAESIGIENAVLTITSEGMSAVAINLSAESTDDFMVLPAENITERTFTTNWTSSANATGYLLDVFVLESNGATAPCDFARKISKMACLQLGHRCLIPIMQCRVIYV